MSISMSRVAAGLVLLLIGTTAAWSDVGAYRPALAAMDRAFEKAGADDPTVVAAAVIEALFRRRPRPRVIVGKGTGALLMLSHLPIRLRDDLVKSALGLRKALRPARESIA